MATALMTFAGLVEWLLGLSLVITGAALLSPIVINASMIVPAERKAQRVRSGVRLATWTLGLAAALCLVRAAADWPDVTPVWPMFAALAAAFSCLTASRLCDGRAHARLILCDRIFMAIAAGLFLLSGFELGSALTWSAAGLILACLLQLLSYWRDSRGRPGRGPLIQSQSNSARQAK